MNGRNELMVTAAPAKVHPRVAAIDPTQVHKRMHERREATLLLGIAFVERHEHVDAPHALALLRARRERPCDRRAAEPSDEFAPSKANAHLPSIAREPVEAA
jgi:hypothetical protein